MHHCNGESEGPALQGPRITLIEPPCKLVDIGCRKGLVTDLVGQFDHGLCPKATVEMVVEKHRRQWHSGTVVIGVSPPGSVPCGGAKSHHGLELGCGAGIVHHGAASPIDIA